MKTYRPPTFEEERALIEKAQAGCIESRNALILGHFAVCGFEQTRGLCVGLRHFVGRKPLLRTRFEYAGSRVQ